MSGLGFPRRRSRQRAGGAGAAGAATTAPRDEGQDRGRRRDPALIAGALRVALDPSAGQRGRSRPALPARAVAVPTVAARASPAATRPGRRGDDPADRPATRRGAGRPVRLGNTRNARRDRVDEDTGKPLEGAEVSLSRTTDGAAPVRTVTEADGSFALPKSSMTSDTADRDSVPATASSDRGARITSPLAIARAGVPAIGASPGISRHATSTSGRSGSSGARSSRDGSWRPAIGGQSRGPRSSSARGAAVEPLDALSAVGQVGGGRELHASRTARVRTRENCSRLAHRRPRGRHRLGPHPAS